MPLFMFTDIQGSTRLWEKHGQAMSAVLERHDNLVRDVVVDYGGRVIKHLGDGFFIVFSDGGDPLGCALTLQRPIGKPTAAPWASYAFGWRCMPVRPNGWVKTTTDR